MRPKTRSLRKIAVYGTLVLGGLCTFAFAGTPPPTCVYSDSIEYYCGTHEGVWTAYPPGSGPDVPSDRITCRMLQTVTVGGDPGAQDTCQYYYCDNNVACPNDHTKFQRKLRTKVFADNLSAGTDCSKVLMVLSTTDNNVDCCFCKMPDTPAFRP